MKKILIGFIGILIFIISTGINAQDDNISKSMLNTMKKIGIDIENILFTELEPDELIKYDDFVKKEVSSQEHDPFVWSTIKHDNLDKLDIKAKSSSTLKGYPVTNLFDNKVETAWVEGVNGDGIGEWVSIRVHTEKYNSPSGLEYFGIIPGYLKSDKTWEENNRVKSALLVFKRQGYIEGKPFTNYAVLRFKLKDFKGLQLFKFPVDFKNSIGIKNM